MHEKIRKICDLGCEKRVMGGITRGSSRSRLFYKIQDKTIIGIFIPFDKRFFPSKSVFFPETVIL